jgi:hypothetical protein
MHIFWDSPESILFIVDKQELQSGEVYILVKRNPIPNGWTRTTKLLDQGSYLLAKLCQAKIAMENG